MRTRLGLGRWILAICGWVPRNRRQRRAAERRRSLVRYSRFDTLEQRVVLNADPMAVDDEYSVDYGTPLNTADYAPNLGNDTDADSDKLGLRFHAGPATTVSLDSGDTYSWNYVVGDDHSGVALGQVRLNASGSTSASNTPTVYVEQTAAGEQQGSVTVNVRLTHASNQTITVDWQTSTGNAVEGSDYSSANWHDGYYADEQVWRESGYTTYDSYNYHDTSGYVTQSVYHPEGRWVTQDVLHDGYWNWENVWHPETTTMEPVFHSAYWNWENVWYPEYTTIDQVTHPTYSQYEWVTHPAYTAIEPVYHPEYFDEEDQTTHPAYTADEEVYHPETTTYDLVDYPEYTAMESVSHPGYWNWENVWHPDAYVTEPVTHPGYSNWENVWHDAYYAPGQVWESSYYADEQVWQQSGYWGYDPVWHDTSGYVTEPVWHTGAYTNFGTLTFLAGETAKQLTFNVIADGDDEGDEAFNLTLNNASGAYIQSWSSGQVTILDDDHNLAPVAHAEGYEIAEDGSLVVTTPDGVLRRSLDFQGESISAVLQQGPQNGSLTLNTDGSFTYTPNANFFGVDTFTYNAQDASGQSSSPTTVTITVSPVNDIPTFTAGSSEITVTEDSGDFLAGWATQIAAGPENESEQTLTWTVTTDHPELFAVQPSVDAEGRLAFRPALNAAGTATLQITLVDQLGEPDSQSSPTSTVTVTITPVQDAPVALANEFSVTPSGIRPISKAALLTGDTDPDAGETATLMITSTSAYTQQGVAVLFDANDNTFYYRAPNGFIGDDTFSYTISDGHGGSSTALATIHVAASGSANAAPVIVTTTMRQPSLPTIAQGISSAANHGMAVVDLVTQYRDILNDPNGTLPGIQITNAPGGLGTWQYSLNGGTSWTTIGTRVVLGTEAGTRIRYQPNATTYSRSAITFRLWDQTDGYVSGSTGSTANGGGTSAYSINTIQALQDISATPGSVHLDDQYEDVAIVDNVGTLISSLTASAPGGSAYGIAITGAKLPNGFGAWQYRLTDESSWTSLTDLTNRSNQNEIIGIVSPNPATFYLNLGSYGSIYCDTADVYGTTLRFQTLLGTAGANMYELGVSGYFEIEFGGVIANQDVGWSITNVETTGSFSYQTTVEGQSAWNPALVLRANSETRIRYSTAVADYSGDTRDALYIGWWDGTDGAANGDVVQYPSNTAISSPYQTVSLRILPSNDAPLSSISVSTIEDTPTEIFGRDIDGDLLTYEIVSAPTHGTVTVEYGRLLYKPEANYFGPVNFQVLVSDGIAAPVTANVGVTVAAKNDAPTFQSGANTVTVSEDSGAYSAPWAVGMSKGPTNEGSQTLSWSVSNNNTSLFSVQPTLAADGRLTFTPAANRNGAATVTVALLDNGGTTNGGINTSGTRTFVIQVDAVNDAPSLTNGATVSWGNTNEETPSPTTTVANLLSAAGWADVDTSAAKGIAVTGTAGNGTWRYSTDGTTWNDFISVSATSALLLTATTQVRFAPDGFNGGSATFDFRAWDQSTGTASTNSARGYADIGTTGGSSAFSTQSATASLTVTSLNDAPTLTAEAIVVLNGTDEDTPSTGTTVATILAASGWSDVDKSALAGIAITATSYAGSWQYSTDGTNWSSFRYYDVSETNALLLSATTQIRYVPDSNNSGTATFSFRAWDQTTGTPSTLNTRSYGNVATNGGTTSYSSQSATASLAVANVNDPPTIFNWGIALPGTGKDTASSESSVAALLATVAWHDNDASPVSGIAVTSTTGSGTWQYSTDGSWHNFGGVSTTEALLLSSATQLRYVPDGAHSEITTLTFRAWDQTTGTASTSSTREHGVPGAGGGSSAYSAAAATASILVNDAPTLANDVTITLTGTDENTAPPPVTVAGLLTEAGWGDVNVNAAQGIAVTGTTGNGHWQYSTDGETWSNFVGTSSTNALLLSATTQIRYAPDAVRGETATLTFRAWDQTAGTPSTNSIPSYGNTSSTGGTTSYSTQAASIVMAVTDVNDAPTLNTNVVVTLTITDEDTASTGTTVASLLSNAGWNDVDAVALSGIAVTSATGNGAWQYLTNGAAWVDFEDVSAAAALLLSSTTQVRYVPDESHGETATFGFRAWDQTFGTATTQTTRSYGNAGLNGGPASFSAQSAVASIVITDVNDAPTFDLYGDVAVSMNDGPQTRDNFLTNLLAGPDGADGPTYTITLTSDNPDLFTTGGQPTLEMTDGIGKLKFTPQFAGSALITVKSEDKGETRTKTFWIDVTEPSFASTGTYPDTTNPIWLQTVSPSIRAPETADVEFEQDLSFTGANAVRVGENLPSTTRMHVLIGAELGTLTTTPSTFGTYFDMEGTVTEINEILATLTFEGNSGGYEDILTITAVPVNSNSQVIGNYVDAKVFLRVKGETTLSVDSGIHGSIGTSTVRLGHVYATPQQLADGDVELSVSWGDGTVEVVPLDELRSEMAYGVDFIQHHQYGAAGDNEIIWTLKTPSGLISSLPYYASSTDEPSIVNSDLELPRGLGGGYTPVPVVNWYSSNPAGTSPEDSKLTRSISAQIIDAIGSEPMTKNSGATLVDSAKVRFTRSSAISPYGMINGSTDGATTIQFHVEDAHAGAPTGTRSSDVTGDFTVVINAGESFKDVVIPIVDDSLRELDETVVLVIDSITESSGLFAGFSVSTSAFGEITIFDNDWNATFTSYNVDTAATGESRLTVQSDNVAVDLFDGRKTWQFPFGNPYLADVQGGYAKLGVVQYDPIGADSPDDARVTSIGGGFLASANDGQVTLRRMSAGIEDIYREYNSQFYDPNPFVGGLGYSLAGVNDAFMGYVDRLVPITIGGGGLSLQSGYLLLRRDGTSAWFDVEPDSSTVVSAATTESTKTLPNGLDQTYEIRYRFTVADKDKYYLVTQPATFNGQLQLLAGNYPPGVLNSIVNYSSLFSRGTIGKSIDTGEQGMMFMRPDDHGIIEFVVTGTTTVGGPPIVATAPTLYRDVTFTSTPAGSFTRPANSSSTPSIVLSLQDGQTYTFDGLGYLTEESDRNNNKTTYAYEVDSNQQSWNIYDSEARRLSQITLPNAGTIQFAYEHIGNGLSAITDPTGLVTRIFDNVAYSSRPDAWGSNGESTQLAAQIGGGLLGGIGTSSQHVDITSFVTDAALNHKAVEGKLGRLDDTLPGDERAPHASMHYYGTDADDNWNYQFDQFGLLVAKSAPAVDGQSTDHGDVWQWDRNQNGQVTEYRAPFARGYTDGLGITAPSDGFDHTEYGYFPNGKLEYVLYSDDVYEYFTYDAAKFYQLSSAIGRDGKTTTFTLDAKGNVLSKIDPLGHAASFTYTTAQAGLSAGLVKTETDADNHITTYDYYTTADKPKWAGLVKSLTYGTGTSDERSERYFYDDYRNLSLQIDVNNVATQFVYDPLGRLLEQRIGVTFNASTGAISGGQLAAKNTYDSVGRLRAQMRIGPDGTPANPTIYDYYGLNRLKSGTDPAASGQYTERPKTEYYYLLDGKMAWTKNAAGMFVVYEYDERRRLIKTTQSGATSGVVQRTSGDAFTESTESEVTYDALDRVLSKTDALGRTTYYTYDAFGAVIRTQSPDPDGSGTVLTSLVTRTEYDEAGRKTKEYVPNPAGLGEIFTAYYYDDAGRLIRIQQPKVHVDAVGTTLAYDYWLFTAYEYYDNGQLKAERSGIAQIDDTDAAWDLADDGTVQNSQPAKADTVWSTASRTYDPLGRLVGTETNYEGATSGPVRTSTSYKIVNDVLVIAETAAAQYAAVAAALTANPSADVTAWQTVTTYDQYGRVAGVKSPDPDKTATGNGNLAAPLTKYEYFDNGQLKKTTQTYAGGDADPKNLITSYTYDELGRTRTVTINGVVTTSTYDKLGRLAETRSSDGSYTTNVYNELGELTTTTQHGKKTSDAAAPEVTSTVYAYDQVGVLYSQTVTGRTQTIYQYDDLDRQTSSQVVYLQGGGTPEARSTTYAQNGMVASTSDGKVQTAYTYDVLGRTTKSEQTQVSSATPTAPRTTTTVFDDVHRTQGLIVNDKTETLMAYDGLGQVTSEQILEKAGGSFAPVGPVQSYAYRVDGSVASVVDRNGREIDYAYDNLGRVVGQTWVGDPNGYAETYAYDQFGNLTGTSGGGVGHAYTFDEKGRLASTTITGLSPTPITLTYAYDRFDRLTSRTDSLGGVQQIRYNAAGQLDTATLQVGTDPAVVAHWTYMRDQLVSRLDRSSPDAGITLRTDYTYDAANHLTGIDHQTTTFGTDNVLSHPATFTYVYDDFNRVTDYTGPDGARHYTYDARGQLLEVSDGAETPTTVEDYDYDAQGNRTASTSTAGLPTAVYDNGPSNRLLSDGTYSYEYDDQGNRTARTNIASGTREEYAWDFRNRLTQVTFKDENANVVQTAKYAYDSNNHRIGKQLFDAWGTLTSEERYVYDGDTLLFVLDGSGNVQTRQFTVGEQTLGQVRTGQPLEWILTDNLGSDRALVDVTGTTIAAFNYDAYGNPVAGSGDPTQTHVHWTGLMLDTETDNYYAWNRFYDPRTGDWISADPIGFKSGTSNLSEYVGNDPTNNVDSSGLEAQPSKDVKGATTPSTSSSAPRFPVKNLVDISPYDPSDKNTDRFLRNYDRRYAPPSYDLVTISAGDDLPVSPGVCGASESARNCFPNHKRIRDVNDLIREVNIAYAANGNKPIFLLHIGHGLVGSLDVGDGQLFDLNPPNSLININPHQLPQLLEPGKNTYNIFVKGCKGKISTMYIQACTFALGTNGEAAVRQMAMDLSATVDAPAGFTSYALTEATWIKSRKVELVSGGDGLRIRSDASGKMERYQPDGETVKMNDFK